MRKNDEVVEFLARLPCTSAYLMMTVLLLNSILVVDFAKYIINRLSGDSLQEALSKRGPNFPMNGCAYSHHF